MTVSRKGGRPKGRKNVRVDWARVKHEYVEDRVQAHFLGTKPKTQREIAEALGVKPQTLHARIRRGGWEAEVQDRLAERKQFIEDVESKAAGKALLHLEQDVSKVLQQHLQIAQEARELVHEHIRSFRCQEGKPLAPRDVIALFRLAVEEERRVLGLAQTKIELTQTVDDEITNPIPKTRDVLRKAIELIRTAEGEYEPAPGSSGSPTD